MSVEGNVQFSIRGKIEKCGKNIQSFNKYFTKIVCDIFNIQKPMTVLKQTIKNF